MESKLIITLFILLKFSLSSFAQGEIKAQTVDVSDKNLSKIVSASTVKQFTDVNINKFLGQWYWANGARSFKLVLSKEVQNMGSTEKPLKIDLLRGGYVLTNGNNITNTLNAKTITGGTAGSNNTAQLLITDQEKKIK